MPSKLEIFATDSKYDSVNDIWLVRLYSDRGKVKPQEKRPNGVNPTDISMEETTLQAARKPYNNRTAMSKSSKDFRKNIYGWYYTPFDTRNK